jgi:hypothetical protein
MLKDLWGRKMKEKSRLVVMAGFPEEFLPSITLGCVNTSLPTVIALVYPDQYQTNPKVAPNMTPKIADLFSIGQSTQGNNLSCLRIMNEENSDPEAGVFIITHYHTQINRIQAN